jgi:pimeloyl-ACP methyl ester carboxylesterase
MTSLPDRSPRPARPDSSAAASASFDTSFDIKAPNLLLMMLEGRAPWEYLAMLAATPWLRQLPTGDGHPVLVLPGLAANDLTTLPLRSFLRERGYTVHGWKQGLNLGPRDGVLEQCGQRLQELAQRHGEKVSLVGWSLGGVYAREVAKEHAGLVRCVITLGSPFAAHPRATNAWRVYELLNGGLPEDDDAMVARLRRAPPVPTTSIYSRTDGVVAWQCSINDDEPHTENIEVHASHMGMGMNPLVMYALVDRLSQRPERWQRFDVQGARQWFYKTPVEASLRPAMGA